MQVLTCSKYYCMRAYMRNHDERKVFALGNCGGAFLFCIHIYVYALWAGWCLNFEGKTKTFIIRTHACICSDHIHMHRVMCDSYIIPN